MNSLTNEKFWKLYDLLPEKIKRQAREAFKRFNSNPYHPSLNFKRIHAEREIMSVRITKDYRAIGVCKNDNIIWFWIGSHSDYEKLIK